MMPVNVFFFEGKGSSKFLKADLHNFFSFLLLKKKLL